MGNYSAKQRKTKIAIDGAEKLIKSLKAMDEAAAGVLMSGAKAGGKIALTDAQKNCPEDTGALKASLKRTQLQSNNRYGYRLEYEGNAPDGTPYAKIASILNSGTSIIKPRRFITKAVKRLKGLDDRAAQRFEEKLKCLCE